MQTLLLLALGGAQDVVESSIHHMQIIGFSKASAELSRILLRGVCVRVCVCAGEGAGAFV